ncbi:MAG: MFS transporter [Pseudomonadota bacterium]|nr:MFS transporter [Pseudomonadota bacterium]
MLPISALLTSVALLLAGGGLLGTLLAVRGRLEGFSDQTLGLIMSGYFVGFFLGTFTAPPLIRRVGHVRAFAFHAALAATSVMAYPLWVDPVGWAVLRVVTGMALVGLITVIESWLNSRAAPEQRSRTFAVYMMVTLVALAVGQLLLDTQPPGSFVLFSVVAILFSLATLPVTTTSLPQPIMAAAPKAGVAGIFRAAPSAAAGALISGLALGAFWGMGPVYASDLGLDRAGVGYFMSITILGGAALQLPIGKLSDQGDRRTAIGLVSALAAGISMMVLLADAPASTTVYALFFVFGGLAFALYPLCVAHLLDRLPAASLLAGCSALLLINGVGAAIGPAVAGFAMDRYGGDALPGLFAASLGLLALLVGGRRLLRARILPHRAHFHPMLRTTPSALELLPEIPEPQSDSRTP